MKHLLLLLLLLIGAALAAGARASADWQAKTDRAVLDATARGGTAEFLVVLDEQADLSAAHAAQNKTARGRAVYEAMTAVAARTQAPLRVLLDERGANYRAYWVHNMIWVRGGRELVQLLAARPDVSAIRANTWQRIDLPVPVPATAARTSDSVEWNIQIVRAPQVWAQGVTGEGAVVGGQDTGYQWDHPALKARYRGWSGNQADHNYNWHDAIHAPLQGGPGSNSCGYELTTPCDDDGHGTHTMGTMVGATPQLNIGMAPGAKWIGCRNMDEGFGSPATYSECFEWFIAPYPLGGDPFTDGDPARAPDVINNSWSCPPSEGCTAPDVLRAVVEAVRAAGIVTVHSAGNNGFSGCSSITTPAAIYDASFTVGATDDQNRIAGFSSRGPVTIDGSGRRKPDIVAPGVDIRSSLPTYLANPNEPYGTIDGTSMAAPHVAGLVALLVSAEPLLAGRVDAIEAIITNSALPLMTDEGCGTDAPNSLPNNVYGWGRIDALAAYEALGGGIITYDVFVPVLKPR